MFGTKLKSSFFWIDFERISFDDSFQSGTNLYSIAYSCGGRNRQFCRKHLVTR
jgi:hypothetical protein